MSKPARVHYTWDDYVELPDDGQRYEVIDGNLFVTPAPVFAHQLVSGELYDLLRGWAKRRAGGVVAYAPVDVVLANDTIVQPDLLWIAQERIRSIVGDRVTGIPDLVVEILSPSTARRDRHKKSEVYARFGAREYWIVDPEKRSVEIRSLQGGAFVTHAAGVGDTPLASALDSALLVVPSALFHDCPSTARPPRS